MVTAVSSHMAFEGDRVGGMEMVADSPSNSMMSCWRFRAIILSPIGPKLGSSMRSWWETNSNHALLTTVVAPAGDLLAAVAEWFEAAVFDAASLRRTSPAARSSSGSELSVDVSVSARPKRKKKS